MTWTPELIAWLRAEAPRKRNHVLAAELSERLGVPIARTLIKEAKKRYGIVTYHAKGWAPGDPANPNRKWTPEQLTWLAKAYRQVTERELRPLMDRAFPGHGFSDAQIAGAVSRYRLQSGRDTRIRPGAEPWNKGLKGFTAGGRSAETRFRPGNPSPNEVPVGSYAQGPDGLWKLKVSDRRDIPARRNWCYLHRLTWEHTHGPIPRGHAVVLLDGDPDHAEDLDNMACVRRAVLVRLNQMNWREQAGGDREAARAWIALATLQQAAHDAATRAGLSKQVRRALLPPQPTGAPAQ